MNILTFLSELLYSGLSNLASYLAAHVLLCLLPAFYIAGAMTALIPKETVTHFLGRNTPKFVSYPAAALAGSLLAVCSCTIVPLFAVIYKKGTGLGTAITFLFFTPAAALGGRMEFRLDGSFPPLGARLRTLARNPRRFQLPHFRDHDGQELRSSYGSSPMKVHNTLLARG